MLRYFLIARKITNDFKGFSVRSDGIIENIDDFRSVAEEFMTDKGLIGDYLDPCEDDFLLSDAVLSKHAEGVRV